MSQQKWLDLSEAVALSPRKMDVSIPQPRGHCQDSTQESTGSGNPSASTYGQIVRPLV